MNSKRDRDAVLYKRWFGSGYWILMFSGFLGHCVWVTVLLQLSGIISGSYAETAGMAFTMGCIGGCIIGLFFWLISLRYNSDML